MFDTHISHFHLIGDEEVSNVDCIYISEALHRLVKLYQTSVGYRLSLAKNHAAITPDRFEPVEAMMKDSSRLLRILGSLPLEAEKECLPLKRYILFSSFFLDMYVPPVLHTACGTLECWY